MVSMRWIGPALLALLGGCLNAGSTVCADGTVCPVGQACTATPGVCSGAAPTNDGGTGDGDACSPNQFNCTNTTWQRMSSGTDAAIVDIWAYADQLVYAVTQDRSLLAYNGSEWQVVATVPNSAAGIKALAVRAPDEIYVALASSELQLWNGSVWSGVTPMSAGAIDDLAVSPDGSIAVAGRTNSGLQRTAGTWNAVTLDGPTFHVDGVGAESSRWCAVGSIAGRIDIVDFATRVPSSYTTNDVPVLTTCSFGNGVFAAGGADGTQVGLYKLNEGTNLLERQDVQTSQVKPITALWVNGAEGFAVGDDSVIYRRGTTMWTQDTDVPPGILSLTSVTASPLNVFAAGTAGTILRRSR
jgi:hypothetical protein